MLEQSEARTTVDAAVTEPSAAARAARLLRDEGWRSVAGKALYYLVSRGFYTPYCTWRARHLGPEQGIERLVDFALNGCWQIIRPAQARDEIVRFLHLLQERRPRTILEIGTARGGTLFLFARVAAEDALLISVDLPHGRFMGGYPAWRAPLYRSFARGRQRVELLRADSHAPASLARVTRVLAGRSVDCLFIDGDHTYDGVAQDFHMYSPLVGPGGLIAFHDIVVAPPEVGGEVHRFWSEVKRRYEHREIINDSRRKSAGIGILFPAAR